MGAAESWIAVKGLSTEEFLKALSVKKTGNTSEIHDWDWSYVDLQNGWQVISCINGEKFLPEDKVLMRRLSCSAEATITGCIEEHVMFSGAYGWSQGRKVWTCEHDSNKGPEHLRAEGQTPDCLDEAKREIAALSAGSKFTDVDYVFDIPVSVSMKICGYGSYTQPYELGFDAFEELQRA
ncbi:MAG: hypothetical protein IAF58_04325 [Leptolyngbya sp.]|nr:hypothetical protein [Candidatus Melainabacteria bacterium]